MLSRPEAVLIVDADDPYVRSLTRQLRELGFPFVYRASSAQQAVAMLDRVHPTLLFIDAAMANLSAQQDVIARAAQLGASITVISAHSSTERAMFARPVLSKATLEGKSLELLVLDLIQETKHRSRNSVTASERVA